jgi:hypothetical protein
LCYRQYLGIMLKAKKTKESAWQKEEGRRRERVREEDTARQ